MMQMNNNNTPLCRTPWGIPSQPKKVVSIPVHFVGSDNSGSTRNKSAMKIQKVVRGFFVRNSMRKIKVIRVEVDHIERKLCDPETKELIKREQKERVKVSESIMNLLLRLDSIRVLDYYSGVRDCRKSAIKKAIALQEMVDQIQMVDPTYQDQPQLTQAEEEKMVDPTYQDQHQFTQAEEEKMMEMEEKEKEKEDGEGVREESVGTSMVEENSMVKEEEEEEEEEEGCKDGRGEEGDYDNNNNKCRELLERMMGDNERMMGMMEQLFERNEMQTRLLTSLSHRVEQLERAYACDKLRKKKRRNVDVKHKQTH